MKYLIYLLAIVLLLALNLGIFPAFNVRGVAPNFLFLLVMLSVLEREDLDFYFLAFFSGLFLDFFSGVSLGSFTLGFVCLVGLLDFLIQNFIIADLDWKYIALIMVGSMLFISLFLWTYDQALFKLGWVADAVDSRNLIRQFPVQLLYNLFFIFPVYVFLDKCRDFINRFVLNRKHRIF